jgi:hypothetical protein
MNWWREINILEILEKAPKLCTIRYFSVIVFSAILGFFSKSNDVLKVIIWLIANWKKIKQFLIVIQLIMKFSSVSSIITFGVEFLSSNANPTPDSKTRRLEWYKQRSKGMQKWNQVVFND